MSTTTDERLPEIQGENLAWTLVEQCLKELHIFLASQYPLVQVSERGDAGVVIFTLFQRPAPPSSRPPWRAPTLKKHRQAPASTGKRVVAFRERRWQVRVCQLKKYRQLKNRPTYSDRCRANMGHTRQSRPDSGKTPHTLKNVSSSLGEGTGGAATERGFYRKGIKFKTLTR